MPGKERTLWVVGVPLDEGAPLDARAASAIAGAALVVGESRRVAMRLLKASGAGREKPIFFLDNANPHDRKALLEALNSLEAGDAVLFSDTGMPILFDPGAEVLDFCRRRGYRVRSIAGPTSWGAAAALSGYEPPFHLIGFPPRENTARENFLRALRAPHGHLVLMDTPYRFKLLLKQAVAAFGGRREAFLAWEISKETERLLWGSLAEIEKLASSLHLDKGEFVLVIHAP